MRRVLVILVAVILIICGFALWWYLRDTPAKVLRDGFSQLIDMKSVKKLNVDLSMTDPVSHATTGFTSVSEANLSDLTHPQSLGILRIGARTSTEQDQTIDVMLDTRQFVFRPRSVAAEYRALYQSLTGDATGTTFLAVNRDALLKRMGYAQAVPGGKAVDVRTSLQYLLPIVIPGDRLSYSADRSQVSATFRFDRRTVKPFLIVLVHAWTDDNPTVDQYAWIDRATEDLGRGLFTLTIDRVSRTPLSLTGNFTAVDDRGVASSDVHAVFQFAGLNQLVSISLPQNIKDVTTRITASDVHSSLPISGERTASSSSLFFSASNTTSSAPTGGAYVTSVGSVVPEGDIDLFQKYSEELRSNKRPY